jgi:2-phosphosulfolactate phosphatase
MEPKMKGKTIVLTTTNGTRAINIASKVPTVVIGSLLNLTVLSEWLVQQQKPTIILCSGWKDKFNLEDTICAGALIDTMLTSGNFRSEEDSSIAAKFIYRSARQNIFGFLKASSHRRRLRRLNLNKDVHYCLTPDTCPVVPVLVNGEIVKMDLLEPALKS